MRYFRSKKDHMWDGKHYVALTVQEAARIAECDPTELAKLQGLMNRVLGVKAPAALKEETHDEPAAERGKKKSNEDAGR